MTENYETALPETFDPAIEEGTHFDLIPVGKYVAQITDACVAQPQSGDGHYVGLTWQITDGDYKGRYVFQHITFLHSSAQATTIGRQQFKDLCVATGISEQVSDVGIFRYIPCQIKVGIEKDKQGCYPDKNKVSRVLPLEQMPKAAPSAEPKKTAASAAATPATATAAKPAAMVADSGNGTTPPWRKQKPTLGEETGDEVPH
jgi:Protein of unknown function (DUF669)